MVLFVDDIILHKENPKDSIKKLVETIIKCSKFAGYKINVQKFTEFLYNNDIISQNKIKKFHLKLSQKILRYELTKDVIYLYTENYKTLQKEIEEGTKRWKGIP